VSEKFTKSANASPSPVWDRAGIFGHGQALRHGLSRALSGSLLGSLEKKGATSTRKKTPKPPRNDKKAAKIMITTTIARQPFFFLYEPHNGSLYPLLPSPFSQCDTTAHTSGMSFGECFRFRSWHWRRFCVRRAIF
jgi:hypothetical protein